MVGRKNTTHNPKPKPKPKSASSKKKKQASKGPNSAVSKESDSGPAVSTSESIALLRNQQRVLDVFRSAFGDELSAGDAFTAAVQDVKRALFDRDFERAFGGQEQHATREEAEEEEEAEAEGKGGLDLDRLAVYAARWSPTRALCYASVLGDIRDALLGSSSSSSSSCSPSPDESGRDNDSLELQNGVLSPEEKEEDPDGDEAAKPRHLKVLCVGGAAAELAAFGSFLERDIDDDLRKISLTLLDSAPWGPTISRLEHALFAPPPRHTYTTTTTTAAVVDPSRLTTHFIQHDALELGSAALTDTLDSTDQKPVLITLLFTLNELFSRGGIGKTTAFLLDLTAVAPAGSLLLVVDSPGSYSEVAVGRHGQGQGEGQGEAKRYPMQWLLDRILLGGAGADAGEDEDEEGDEDGGGGRRRWRKLEAHDSLWFRLPSGLDYPIALENMRYQMHLYRVESTSTTT